MQSSVLQVFCCWQKWDLAFSVIFCGVSKLMTVLFSGFTNTVNPTSLRCGAGSGTWHPKWEIWTWRAESSIWAPPRSSSLTRTCPWVARQASSVTLWSSTMTTRPSTAASGWRARRCGDCTDTRDVLTRRLKYNFNVYARGNFSLNIIYLTSRPRNWFNLYHSAQFSHANDPPLAGAAPHSPVNTVERRAHNGLLGPENSIFSTFPAHTFKNYLHALPTVKW